MKNLRIFPLVLALCLCFAVLSPSAAALDAPALSAQAVLLVDLDSGRILYEKNADQQRSPASLTKVMTMLLVLEAVDRGELGMEDLITAGSDCRQGMRDDSSSVGILPGEEMTLRDLLYCAAVASGNDACNVLAVATAGSISAFVERMNQRAAELGCDSTHFVDPNGLSSEDLTCARDLYRITREAISHPDFWALCDTPAYTVPETNFFPARELKSSNALLSPDGIHGPGYYYEGAHGIKTGYTRAAGYCLISTAERNGLRLLAIVMGCDGPYLSDTTVRRSFTDSAKLYDWVFDDFAPRELLTPGAAVGYADVALSGGAQVPLLPADPLQLLLPKDLDPSELEYCIELREQELIAPVRAGELLGTLRILQEGRELAATELVAALDISFYLRVNSPAGGIARVLGHIAGTETAAG